MLRVRCGMHPTSISRDRDRKQPHPFWRIVESEASALKEVRVRTQAAYADLDPLPAIKWLGALLCDLLGI